MTTRVAAAEVRAARVTGGAAEPVSRAVLVSALAGALILAGSLLGITRYLGTDELSTVGSFVATPSLKDPFIHQSLFNNHPFFSFLDHIVYTVTGSQTAWVMRIVPLVAGTLTVVILTFVVTRRFGWLPGAVAGLYVATNPEFVRETSSVRGYTQLALCALGATLVLLHLLDRPDASWWWEGAYAALIAAGVATHLYMLLVVGGHFVFISARRQLRVRWLVLWMLGGGLGSMAYLYLAHLMWIQGRSRGQIFHAAFPRDELVTLLGNHPVSVVAWGILVGIGITMIRRGRVAYALAAAYAGVMAAIWLVVQPHDFYTRFLMWVTPAVGVAAAMAVRRFWRLAILALIGAVFSFSYQVTRWDQAALNHVPASRLVIAAAKAGERTCATGYSASMLGYTKAFRDISNPKRFAQCDLVVVLLPGPSRSFLPVLRRQFPYLLTIHSLCGRCRAVAKQAFVFSRTPQSVPPRGRHHPWTVTASVSPGH